VVRDMSKERLGCRILSLVGQLPYLSDRLFK